LSKYRIQPLDFGGLKTVSIHDRGGKVRLEHFANRYEKGAGVLGILDAMPRLLAADSLRSVAEALLHAKQAGKQIIWGMGGHVIKCGLAPVLLDLMNRGYATAFAMNGSAAIHDFEIAIAGWTSEDVEAVLPDGRFGSAEETGREMNLAISEGDSSGLGMGEALGLHLSRLAGSDGAMQSLVLGAWHAGIPVTVHVAIGTDTPHTHPAADGGAIGSTSHRDFRLFTNIVTGLDDGGVYVNLGSAVVMPEVFLKAISVARNLGYPLAQFTTVNMDFLQHYRPKMNVVERPHAQSGGKGYSITGHHEMLVPLLAAILIECEA
jgi:hypothetical protein